MRILLTLGIVLLFVVSVEAQEVFVDESSPGWLFVDLGNDGGAAAIEHAGATPAVGINALQFYQSTPTDNFGTINLSSLQEGQKYTISDRRVRSYKEYVWLNTPMSLQMNGEYVFVDFGVNLNEPLHNTYQEASYRGYYEAGATNLMTMTGGPWGIIVDWLKFTPTNDIYGDETNMTLNQGSDPGIAGDASLTNGTLDGNFSDSQMPFTPYGDNSLHTWGDGSLSGTADLQAGVLYNVFANMYVDDNGLMGLDMSINGEHFATNSGIPQIPPMFIDEVAYPSRMEELLLGTFTADGLSTYTIQNTAGGNGLVLDYLRFEVVPEPVSMCLLLTGLPLLLRRKK